MMIIATIASYWKVIPTKFRMINKIKNKAGIIINFIAPYTNVFVSFKASFKEILAKVIPIASQAKGDDKPPKYFNAENIGLAVLSILAKGISFWNIQTISPKKVAIIIGFRKICFKFFFSNFIPLIIIKPNEYKKTL